MSVLSDKTIRKLCKKPLGVSKETGDFIYREDFDKGDWENYEDEEIREIFLENHLMHPLVEGMWSPMIEPFCDQLVRENDDGEKIISYGLSSYGYDVRLSPEQIKIFTNANGTLVDPMDLDEECLVNAKIRDRDTHPHFILPPNSYALGSTMERVNIPKNVSVICVGKSTLARAGAIVNVTPIEAGFRGSVVIEISNGSTLPIKVYLGVGIAQFQFLYGDQVCESSYDDGERKYQGQSGITLSKV